MIDIHTHIFPDKIAASTIEFLRGKSHTTPFTDGTLTGLISSMKKFSVDYSVILPVATKPEQVTKINDNAAQINEKFFDEGIISFAGIHPNFENFSGELSRIKNFGFKGIKVHPVYQDTNLDDKNFLRIFYRAAELDLIVVTHAGLDIGYPNVVKCTPKMARHVIEEIGEFNFILAHMGGWKSWDEVLTELADVKIFMDTAFSTEKIPAQNDGYHKAEDLPLLDAEKFSEFVKVFGSDKIIFGTDSPWTSQGKSIEFIKNLPISDADKNKILHDNAAKLLQLK
ncbi:MAG: amidohydrolase family protein [Selenomonadaceae bacterium]|nr:amidohydrolase family protein [Selenomonadaceae bacterium]